MFTQLNLPTKHSRSTRGLISTHSTAAYQTLYILAIGMEEYINWGYHTGIKSLHFKTGLTILFEVGFRFVTLLHVPNNSGKQSYKTKTDFKQNCKLCFKVQGFNITHK